MLCERERGGEGEREGASIRGGKSVFVCVCVCLCVCVCERERENVYDGLTERVFV